MTGGLLNLVSQGNQNIILNGNPKKTFFKTSFQKFTNFGLQKYRIDFNGTNELQLNQDSKFTFKIPRYGDLLMDTYVVITLPDIWSPLYKKTLGGSNYIWIGHDFKWIKNLGNMMIKEIEITIGGQTIQKYSGSYLQSIKERDGKNKNLHDQMTGNVDSLNDPANSYYGNSNTHDVSFNYVYSNNLSTQARVSTSANDSIRSSALNYPNAIPVDTNGSEIEPSIRGRKLYIPISSWFSNDSKMSLPLVSLQYSEVHINVTFRPIADMFVVRDVTDMSNNFPYKKPNFNTSENQIWRYLQEPKTTSNTDYDVIEENYNENITRWNSDIHIISTYCFLSDEERRVFAVRDQEYLIKEVHEHSYKNITGSNKVSIESGGLVSDFMFYFQRTDINERNEWFNLSNWSYEDIPEQSTSLIPHNSMLQFAYHKIDGLDISNNLLYTNTRTSNNKKEILENLAIICDGKYREESMDVGIFNYIEKYSHTSSDAKNGFYCYSFGINSDYNDDYQPSGAINLSKFSKIEIEFKTIQPPLDPSNVVFTTICDEDGNIIGINKPSHSIYKHNYDLTVFEERYNILKVISGSAALQWA